MGFDSRCKQCKRKILGYYHIKRNNNAELGVLAWVMSFVIILSITAYFTVGDVSYGYDDNEYTDPISNMNSDFKTAMEEQNDEIEEDKGLLAGFIGWLWSLSPIDDAIGWAVFLDGGTVEDADNVTENMNFGVGSFAGAFWNMFTLNIPALNSLGIVGVGTKVFVWMISVYCIIKLLPFT